MFRGPNPPKTHFLGPFNAKPITERALRKSHVNEATMLKLYSHIGIGKYLAHVKIFPLGGVRRARGCHLMSLMPCFDPVSSVVVVVVVCNTWGN